MRAIEVIEAYHNAWTTGNIAKARGLLADDLDFKGSIDTFTSAEPFIAALGQFSSLLERVDLLHSFHAEDGGALLYDCVTRTPAGIIRTAEFFRVADGKIREIRLVFDATELRKLMGR